MPIIHLNSLEDDRLDAYVRLTEPQLRNKLEPEKGIFIAESFKVIERALRAGHEPLSFLLEEKWIERCEPMLAQIPEDVPAFVLPTDEIRRLTGFTLTRGILAAMRRPPLRDLSEVLDNAQHVAVFEGITDHTNLGAIFRNAAALNVDAVLLTPTCCDPLYRRSVRVSMGTVFQVPWTRIGTDHHDWPDPAIEQLKQRKFMTIAMALDDRALDIRDPRLVQTDKRALLFGTESDGLTEATIAACDHTAMIPMANGVDSLNVAASTAVAFWQLFK